MNDKKTVGILYGGKSVEHEISIRSAKNVVANIDKDKYNVVLIAINKKGQWYLSHTVEPVIDTSLPVAIKLDSVEPVIVSMKDQSTYKLDIVFPVLHGTDGEDGSVQGLFKTCNIPVVGSGVLGSAVSMDKILAKKILIENKVPVAKYLDYDINNYSQVTFEEITDKVGLPFMIKSGGLGSSVGVSKVKNKEGFESALKESFKYDSRILIEEFIEGRELECAVIGNEKPEASMPGEIIMVKDYEFYTYTAKYLDEDAIRIQIPAEVDDATTAKIRELAIRAYKSLRCEDFARVDLFLQKDGTVVINEINTIPGFTSASMFPMMWEHMGISYTDLVTKLIDTAFEKFDKSQAIDTHYIVLD